MEKLTSKVIITAILQGDTQILDWCFTQFCWYQYIGDNIHILLSDAIESCNINSLTWLFSHFKERIDKALLKQMIVITGNRELIEWFHQNVSKSNVKIEFLLKPIPHFKFRNGSDQVAIFRSSHR